MKGPQHPGDIIIYDSGRGVYAIVKMDGEQIGTSDDRRDAMRRACAAADDPGATVWVCVDPSFGLYNEVLCP
jgi:hypothetical protein